MTMLESTTASIDSMSEASATIVSHSPQEIRWDVTTDEDRLLVVSEMYYPAGWKAFLDEDEVPIHRVNFLLRGIEVPTGSHELVMRFEPASYRIGYLVSLLSTLFAYGGLAVILGVGFVRREGYTPRNCRCAMISKNLDKVLGSSARPVEDGGSGKYIKSTIYGGLDGIITTFAVVAGVAGASLSSWHRTYSWICKFVSRWVINGNR